MFTPRVPMHKHTDSHFRALDHNAPTSQAKPGFTSRRCAVRQCIGWLKVPSYRFGWGGVCGAVNTAQTTFPVPFSVV